MSTFCRSRLSTRLFSLFSIVCLSAMGSTARCTEPWPSTGPNAGPAYERIRGALENDTRLDFIDTPLEQVVAFLQDQHDVNVQIDVLALDAYGIGTDVPVTTTLKGLSFGSALKILLSQLELTYIIENEALVITTMESARSRPELRVYSVAALLEDGADSSRLAATLHQALLPEGGPAPSMAGGMGGMGGGGFFAVQDEEAAGGGYGGGGYGGGGYGGGGYGGDYGEASGMQMGPAPATRASLPRIIPHRQLLIVRHTTIGQDEVARLLGAMAAALDAGQ